MVCASFFSCLVLYFMLFFVNVSESHLKLYGNILGHFLNHIWSNKGSSANKHGKCNILRGKYLWKVNIDTLETRP